MTSCRILAHESTDNTPLCRPSHNPPTARRRLPTSRYWPRSPSRPADRCDWWRSAMHKRLQACAKPGGLSSSYRSCPTSTASFSESVCSEATARSRRFGGKRTYALNFPVWSDGLRRGLGNEFEIGGCLHHQYPKANRSRLAFFHARNASIGAVSGRRLADAHAVWAPFPPRQRLSVLGFSLRPVVGTRGHLLV